MGKKNKKSSQFPPTRTTTPTTPTTPTPYSPVSTPSSVMTLTPPEQNITQVNRVQPEEMSLNAHKHIQQYLRLVQKNFVDKEDLNAVLRLSQHLRVFGLVSAVGYLNQSNAQEGKVRERTVPVWKSLLGQLIDEQNSPNERKLMDTVVEMARTQPAQYMATWRKSMILSNHWNFWARAYQEQD